MPVKTESEPGIGTQYSFWIVPAEPVLGQLRARIRDLALQFEAIYFEPHVTIYSGTSNDEESQRLAHLVASRFTAFELMVGKLDFTASYTKTLFIRLGDPGAAGRMFDEIRQGSAVPSDYVLDPHLSLLYKNIPETTQAELCRTQEIPAGACAFDRLRVIETEIPLSRPEQIARWRTVCDLPLGIV